MKTLFTYSAFSLLLLVCYMEKNCIRSTKGPVPSKDPVPHERFFEGRFDDDPDKGRPFLMKLEISDGFVSGSYRPDGSWAELQLTGALNQENELIFIESRNGKMTGIFKGAMYGGNSRLLRFRGIRTSASNDRSCGFSMVELGGSRAAFLLKSMLSQ